ncbi:odorant receptor 63a-like isoform X2 [Diachasmimorpha longicaudata]|uniref:odorant receptor 63a-like isoform X2 n=1 Tax=Diachasmimorpha longicaudata TaxID=58733 RepID=UPI0030B8F470
MEFWNQRHYSCLKVLSCLLGLWPYQSSREILIYRTAAVVLFILQTTPQILALKSYYYDFQLVMESMTYFMIEITFIVNFVTYLFQFNKMRNMLDMIREDWGIFTEDNGLRILHTYASQGQKFSVLYAGSLYVSGVFTTLKPLQLRLMNILFKSNISVPKFFIPMDYGMINVDKYYYGLLCLSEMSVSIIVVMVLAYDLFFFLCAQHICGLFTALGVAVEKIPTDCQLLVDGTYNYLKTCVTVHKRILRFVNLLDEILRWNTFILLGFTMIDLSMIELQLALHLDDIGEVLKNLVFIGSVMTRFFIICFVAQRVTDHSVDFQNNLINSRWCDISLKSRHLIKFFIMRSQRPCQLTTGKVLVMSFQLFTVVVKASGSYFTMLLAMQGH